MLYFKGLNMFFVHQVSVKFGINQS